MSTLTLRAVQIRRKQLLAGLVAIIAVAVLFIRSYWIEAGAVHEAIEDTGLFLILFCILGRAWSTLYIGGRKINELVREGPYSIVRNPLYLFSFIGIVGIGAGAGSVVMGLILFAISYVVFRWVVAHEEAFLAQKYEEDYARYLREVPRFIPDFRRWHDIKNITVTPRLVVRATLEASLFFLAYPVFEAIEWLQSLGVFATPIILP
ncbi:MAG: isoprenylcysteine carboxylmethyltransferase family protein [Hyphomicrobiales bacterium]|nr:isoprenylcysteine carboxylmethyltransferase family protein [Hyphomicrobiales bacterium]